MEKVKAALKIKNILDSLEGKISQKEFNRFIIDISHAIKSQYIDNDKTTFDQYENQIKEYSKLK